MNNAEQLTTILTYSLAGIVMLLFVLLIVFVIVKIKTKKKDVEEKISNIEPKETKRGPASSLGANKQSIHKFMEFDTVDDNMIIQNQGKRFLMVIECQGINYDLMSGMEKTGVEDGFLQFLNSLRNPIQIYIQTRSVNLEDSIQTYKDKIKKIEEKLNVMKINYEQMVEAEEYSNEDLERAYFELTRLSNLYEYGRDIVSNTEKMSLNKNILNKKYYIIVPYYAAELELNNTDKEETKNLVFSELYTRAQSIVRMIGACGVKGKILKSNELVELLYMAYNRDEAEVFGYDRAVKAGYDEIYSTAPEVLDKKMKEIDKIIEKKAIEKAEEKLGEALNERERELLDRQMNLNELIDEYALMFLEENRGNVEDEVIENAKSKIEETQEGGKGNDEEPKKTRGRKPKITRK